MPSYYNTTQAGSLPLAHNAQHFTSNWASGSESTLVLQLERAVYIYIYTIVKP